jgi:hypothetical protein
VLIGVPVLATLTTIAAPGRVQVGPLATSRRARRPPPSAWRALPLAIGIGGQLAYSASLVGLSEDRPYEGELGALRPGVVEVYAGGVPESQVAPLLAERAVATRSDPGRADEVVGSCDELARVVVLSCASGLPGDVSERAAPDDSDLAIVRVYVPTDGTAAAENRVRTRAANLVPNAIIHTQQDRVDVDARYLANLEQLMRGVWYLVLVAAACSLAVGMVAGLIERRRPFALLRASGLRLGELRQVVFLETAAAMLVTAAVGVGLGLASSYALAVFSGVTWAGPDVGVFAMVGVGVLAALVLSTMTLPLLDVTTRHDAVRYE